MPKLPKPLSKLPAQASSSASSPPTEYSTKTATRDTQRVVFGYIDKNNNKILRTSVARVDKLIDLRPLKVYAKRDSTNIKQTKETASHV